MSKHTPGPWTVRAASSGATCYVEGPANPHKSWLVAEVCGRGEVNIDNARLISAAPDLYAVAKEMQEAWAYFSEYDVPIGIKDRLDAAIAKTEGGEG